MKRRDFLHLLGSAPLLAGLYPSLSWGAPSSSQKLLILIEFKGGNDGLNTVIPFQDPTYYSLRPQLAIPRDQVLPLSETLGFHPALKALYSLFQRGQLAVVNGVGYPNPNRSHFRSIDIWETGSDSNEYLSEGWIAELYRAHPLPKAQVRVATGIILGTNPGPLDGDAMRNVVMTEPGRLVRQAARLKRQARATQNPSLRHILKVRADIQQAADEIAAKVQPKSMQSMDVPPGKFGKSLQALLKLLQADVHAPVVKMSLGSFDTHAGQLPAHRRLLTEFSDGLEALEKGLKKLGLWQDSLIMTYSEFGRRPAQNGSNGTDHGTAAPHFVMGGAVKGGLYGKQPSLTDLAGGDLKYGVHFRDLYATIAKHWWNGPTDFLGAAKRGQDLGFL